jgi:hypothetical protein
VKAQSTGAKKLMMVIDTMETLDTDWEFAGEVSICDDTLCCYCDTEDELILKFVIGHDIEVITVDSLHAVGGVLNEKLTKVLRSLT